MLNMEDWSVEQTVERLCAEPSPDAMSEDNERHLEDVQDGIVADLDRKYRAGQVEHGGKIWLKPAMMKHLRDEIVDLVVYQDVTRQQLEGMLTGLDYALDVQAWGYVQRVRDELHAMLHGAHD